MKPLIISFPALALTLFCGCATSLTTLDVLEPSQIVLPDEVQTIATIDRSRPEKGFSNVLEGIFSGEAVGQDREGRKRALESLTGALTRTPRFQVRGTGIEMNGSSNGSKMAGPLPWSEIESICQRYDADVVAAIESFDTNTDIFYSTRQSKQKKDGKEVVTLQYTARRQLRLYVGWRLYDPRSRAILDENIMAVDKEDTGYGNSQERAAANLPGLINTTRNLSAMAGELYGRRIAPLWIKVNRVFYTSGKGAAKAAMAQANRHVETGRWESAMDIWLDLVNQNPDPKTAGRATHNLAVAYEREGDLASALQWAEKAYLDFNHTASRTYIDILRQRIADQRRLEEQLKDRP